MTNNKPGSDLISLQMAPLDHHHSIEKVPSPVTMNNLGARLILEGRHLDALRCLATSMKHARALLSRGRQPRRASNDGTPAVMSCKPVNPPSSVVVTGRGDADATTNTTVPFSMDHSSLEEQSASGRRGPSLHSAGRRITLRHGSAGTMNSSISRQQQEAGRTSTTTTSRTPMETFLGRLSTTDAPSSTTTKVDEDQPTDDFARRTTTPSPAVCSQKTTVKKLSLGTSNTFVYADPIVLDDEPVVCHRHQQCLMKITVTILFNMALAHHLMARSTLTRLQEEDESWDEERRNELQRHCTSDLKRAVALYTLSCRIHVFERLSMNEMIAMAHLNNLGQIHAILGNTSLSKAFFEKLLSNLALYTESNRDGKHQATRRGRRRRLAGFYRNAAQIILRGPELAPAA